MAAEEHRLGCLHMMGLCALDLGRHADAVAHLEQALALPDLATDQQVPLRFDLGRAYASQGDVARAREAFEAVRASDPSFADVEVALAALPEPGQEREAQDAAEPEALEAFDPPRAAGRDATAAQDAGEPEEPAYESFDDLLSDDAETQASPEEPAAEEPRAEPPAAPSESEPASDTGGPGRRPRRRKISFV
jgi:tetratricopeptide (TPR) repeat protein